MSSSNGGPYNGNPRKRKTLAGITGDIMALLLAVALAVLLIAGVTRAIIWMFEGILW